MTDERVLTVVVIATYGGAGLLGAALFGGVVLTVFLAIAVIWLTWDRDRANERAEVNADETGQARDEASEALYRVEQLEREIDDAPSTGRHAHGEPCHTLPDSGLVGSPQPGEAVTGDPAQSEGEPCET